MWMVREYFVNIGSRSLCVANHGEYIDIRGIFGSYNEERTRFNCTVYKLQEILANL